MNERNEFIARMEASGIAPTWDTIYDLNVALAALRADLATVERQRDPLRKAAAASADRVHTLILEDTCDRLRKTVAAQNHEIEQILGAALGYPRYCDDQKNFPGATEADGVCVGYHVAETLATEAAARIATLQTGKGVASPDYEFLHNELAATQRRDRERLETAIEALTQIFNWAAPTSATYRVTRKALMAITSDGEKK